MTPSGATSPVMRSSVSCLSCCAIYVNWWTRWGRSVVVRLASTPVATGRTAKLSASYIALSYYKRTHRLKQGPVCERGWVLRGDDSHGFIHNFDVAAKIRFFHFVIVLRLRVVIRGFDHEFQRHFVFHSFFRLGLLSNPHCFRQRTHSRTSQPSAWRRRRWRPQRP